MLAATAAVHHDEPRSALVDARHRGASSGNTLGVATVATGVTSPKSSTEGIPRLEALGRAWEYLRLDARTGMSVWFRDHADHHMTVLLSAEGPFKGCKPDGHGERLKPLPLSAPSDNRATLR